MPFVGGLVLAAGGSSRLGRPKQLLPYRGGTLLDWTVGIARRCDLDQLIVVLGGGLEEVRRQVDLEGVDVVVNDVFTEGCSSSIAAALGALDPRCDVLVLLLGDQPGVRPVTVRTLLAGRGDAAVAACRYDDGLGHPLAFSRAMFGELAGLHGDKAVWRLLDENADRRAEVPTPGAIPRDVDTWEDYEHAVREHL